MKLPKLSSEKGDWKLWLQVLLAVVTAIASALGVTSCAMRIML